MNLKRSILLSKLFSWAWFRHIEQQHDAQYEDCCPDLICRLAWFAERWLWYGGRHEWELTEED